MKENTKFADQSKLYYSSTLFSHLSLKNIFQFFSTNLQKIIRPTKCFTKIYNMRDLRILTIFDILYAIMFCQGPVCYPGTVVTGWGTERNNNFIFHSGHTTPSSLWDLNILNTNKLVDILMFFGQFHLLSFFCNVDPSSWWWQPIVTMVLVKVMIIHHSPTKECILVHWSNIMPTNDPSSFYNWCFSSAPFLLQD